MKTYSVGNRTVYCYCDTAVAAFKAHASEGVSRRVGVYEWEVELRDGARVIKNQRRLSWPVLPDTKR